MQTWVRNAVMLIVVVVWAVYIAGAMLNGQNPPAAVWAVPGVTYAALMGGLGSLGKRIKVTVEDQPPPPDKAVEHKP